MKMAPCKHHWGMEVKVSLLSFAEDCGWFPFAHVGIYGS